MLGYLAAIAVVLLLTRWVFYALRPQPPRVALDGPSGLRTLAVLVGPDFADDPEAKGEPLARAIRAGLAARGFAPGDAGAASQADTFSVTVDGDSYEVVSRRVGDLEETNLWAVTVQRAARPGERAAPRDTPGARRLLAALHEVLASLPGVRRLRWRLDDDRPLGDASEGSARPF